MSRAADVRMGVWRHFKGPMYLVQGLAHDANHEGRTCVVYVGLELDGAHLGPRLAVRTIEDFLFPDMHLDPEGWRECGPGCEELPLHEPRFEFLGAELEGWMLR